MAIRQHEVFASGTTANELSPEIQVDGTYQMKISGTVGTLSIVPQIDGDQLTEPDGTPIEFTTLLNCLIELNGVFTADYTAGGGSSIGMTLKRINN